jgi:hypothetical protein
VHLLSSTRTLSQGFHVLQQRACARSRASAVQACKQRSEKRNCLCARGMACGIAQRWQLGKPSIDVIRTVNVHSSSTGRGLQGAWPSLWWMQQQHMCSCRRGGRLNPHDHPPSTPPALVEMGSIMTAFGHAVAPANCFAADKHPS